MTTTIVEIDNALEVIANESSRFDEVLHHYDPIEVMKCAQGFFYKSTCGMTFDPALQSLGESAVDLDAMDKCVMCQTVIANR